MKKWLWLLFLPSLAFAKWPASSNMRKDPIYIDVQPDQITILPDKVVIPAADFATPHHKFEQFLDDLERVHTVRYSILVLRPGSVDLHRRVRQLIQDRNLDMGFEPVETGRYIPEVVLNPDNYLSTTSHLTAAQAASVVEFFYSKRCPFEIEVRSNSLTILTNRVALASELRLFEVEANPNAPAILTNQVVVTREELDVAGNPFERYLDQYRAHKSQGPYSYRKEPGSDEFFAEVMKYSYEHGARKGVWDDVMSATPIEVPANDRAPVYLECRGDQLFAIAADAPPAPFAMADLTAINPKTQYLCLLVRPDGFEVFRKARKAAWERGLDVSCELQNESGPFAIGPEGTPPLFPKPESPAPIRSPKTQDLLDRADAFLSKAEAFSIHPFISSNQSPVHVEIWPERIAISPEMSGLVATGDPEKDFESLLGRMEDMRETHYFVLIPHPGGAIFQRRLRQQLKERGIDVMVQLPETHFEAASRTIMDFHGALPPRPASETRNEPPCDIEVRSNAITILPDRNVVTLDELRVSGNAFERLLDRFEAQGECPNVQLCEMPGGEKLKSQLGGQIFLAAKSMGCQMKIEALFPETDLPDGKRDRPTAGAAGFECRHGLLYDLSDPASAGHSVRFRDPEDSRWLDAKLAAVVSANKSIRFYVRPDGFEPYRNARMMAWILGIPFSKTVLNENEPLPAID